jgi:hypothetical protein
VPAEPAIGVAEELEEFGLVEFCEEFCEPEFIPGPSVEEPLWVVLLCELLASGVLCDELGAPTLELDPLCDDVLLCELWSWLAEEDEPEASGAGVLLCGTVAEGLEAPVVLCESVDVPTELPLGEVALGVC